MTSTNTVYTMDEERLRIDFLFKSIEQLRCLTGKDDLSNSLINSAEELLHRQGETGVNHCHAVALLISELQGRISNTKFLKLPCDLLLR